MQRLILVVHPKMKIWRYVVLSHVVPNPHYFLSCIQHKSYITRNVTKVFTCLFVVIKIGVRHIVYCEYGYYDYVEYHSHSFPYILSK